MGYLFDLDKPYFAAWLKLHDIDTEAWHGSTFYNFTSVEKLVATPLYYAAFCGFQDLVEHLTVNDPKQVNATGGYYVTPLVAALAAGHFQTAKFLSDNGAHSNVRGFNGATPLLSAAYYADLEMVQVLLKYKANVNARDEGGDAPLHLVSYRLDKDPNIDPSMSNVTRLLLEHGADINARSNDHSTPLHVAARNGWAEVVHVLLQHGADVGGKNGSGRTALQLASDKGHDKIVKLLSEYRARSEHELQSYDG
ncbi:ankyrin repeat-containing domain protein [Russula ochroleuca]|jgi:ankyrin repeat protein|uniref:Ankyrin repeat-containing domain protein n=1 Tax=Russula ochroleuca TaxID=152965 RepID=A0A9P5JWI2_9AGAM|nr:ankyrin repeat-containing domain protein [Russula ochroleuca]